MGGANPQGCANFLFGQTFAENCMKMKDIRRETLVRSAPSPLPPRSANLSCNCFDDEIRKLINFTQGLNLMQFILIQMVRSCEDIQCSPMFIS